jgi:hypothetical protein
LSSSSFTDKLWITMLLTAFAVAVLQLSIFHHHLQHPPMGAKHQDGGAAPSRNSIGAKKGEASKKSNNAGAVEKKRGNVPPAAASANHRKSDNLQQPSEPSSASMQQHNMPNYHVVFSSSCTDQQDWEAWVLFYHAWKVNQPGNVTRIVSGCNPERAAKLQEHHDLYVSRLSARFHLHLTPDYSRLHLENGKLPYKYMNKPYGLKHWMENALHISNATVDNSPHKDDVVILMDPDMVLLRPLVHDWRGRDDVVWSLHSPNETLAEDDRVVRRGHPIAQHDGYLTSDWMRYPPSYSNGTILQRPKNWGDGAVHYNSGPPYMAVVSDMYQLAVRWTVWAPRVLEIHPQLFAGTVRVWHGGFHFRCSAPHPSHPSLLSLIRNARTDLGRGRAQHALCAGQVVGCVRADLEKSGGLEPRRCLGCR